MKEIQLTKGYSTLVDDIDYPHLSKHKWNASKHCDKIYAKTHVRINGESVNVYMHRILLGLTKKNELCDHKDRDTLNNQRSNLRKCTWSDNQRNKTKKRNAKSIYLGVTKAKSRWMAQLTYKGNHVFIGTFLDEKEAALAYNKKASELFGEFVNLNVL